MSYLEKYLSTKSIPKETIDSLSKETVSFASALDVIAQTLPEISETIANELRDQRKSLKLIHLSHWMLRVSEHLLRWPLIRREPLILRLRSGFAVNTAEIRIQSSSLRL